MHTQMHASGDDHDISLDVPVEVLSSTHFNLIYTHLEVLVDNKKVSKLLRTPAFNQKVKAIVADEAYLVGDCYVSRLFHSQTLFFSDAT